MSSFKKFIFQKVMSHKIANAKKNRDVTSGFDFVLAKLRKILGGKVKMFVTGSAPMDKDIMYFLESGFSAKFIQAYGQTENIGLAFKTDLKQNPDIVGGVICNLVFKLVDVPEMNYFHTDKDSQNNQTPRGELWLKGNIIPFYFKGDSDNKSTFTEDGWLKTGDVGMLRHEDQGLVIIDRCKNIFKLSQGEYIAPSKIEDCLKSCECIDDVFIYGNSLKSYIVAIVVINPVKLQKIAEDLNIKSEDLINNETIKKHVLEQFEPFYKKNDIKGFEKIKSIHIETSPFDQIGLMNPSMKLVRHQATKHYSNIFEKLYKGLD